MNRRSAKRTTGCVNFCCRICGRLKETADEPTEQEPESEAKGILARGKGFFKKAGEAIGDTFADLSAKAMIFSEENFKNKKAMERQMLFYGVICLYNEGLETFMNA